MKRDPIFIFSAYVRNKLSGSAMRIAKSVMKLKKVSRSLDNKDIDDVIQDLIKVDQKIEQVFSRTDRFLGKLRAKEQKNGIVKRGIRNRGFDDYVDRPLCRRNMAIS